MSAVIVPQCSFHLGNLQTVRYKLTIHMSSCLMG
jgi:hypothetical protein